MKKPKTPKHIKLLRSAGISIAGVVAVLILKWLFPQEDFSATQALVLGAVCSWLVATVRELNK